MHSTSTRTAHQKKEAMGRIANISSTIATILRIAIMVEEIPAIIDVTSFCGCLPNQ